MKTEYDKDVDAAYIYVDYPSKAGAVKKTIKVDEHIFLDFDENNKLLGIEILDASKVLRKEKLAEFEV